MKNRFKIYEDLEYHILNDDKPSIYIEKLFEDEKIGKIPPFNMLWNLKDIMQNPKYHPEGSVWNHTLLVVDEAAKRRELSINVKVFMWAALLHDIGKAPTTRVKNGKITSYNHEKAGYKMALEFLKEFTDDNGFIEDVTVLIRWHMEPLYVLKNLPFVNLSKMISEVEVEEIALLAVCDRLGRGDMSNKKAFDEKKGIEMFVKKCKEFCNKEFYRVKKSPN